MENLVGANAVGARHIVGANACRALSEANTNAVGANACRARKDKDVKY